MSTSKLNVVELYAGTARSSEPFRRWRRCRISLLVDNDQFAADTYRINYPDSNYLVEDLTDAAPDRLAQLAGGKVHILLGCPPCQGFSDNGRKSPWDRRNRHLKNYARLAVSLRPLAIAMENVPLAGKSRAFAEFTKMIEAAGYYWTAGIVNAALRGSSQCRQRLLFIAIRDTIGWIPLIPSPTHGGCRRYFGYHDRQFHTLRSDADNLLGVAPATRQVRALLPYREEGYGDKGIPVVGEAISGLPAIGTPEAQQLGHVAWAHTPRQRRRMANVPEGGQLKCASLYYSQSYARLHRHGLARTITTAFPNAGSGRFWHPIENRTLTLREAARIQGFPDSFRFPGLPAKRAFLVGNAHRQGFGRNDLRNHSRLPLIAVSCNPTFCP